MRGIREIVKRFKHWGRSIIVLVFIVRKFIKNGYISTKVIFKRFIH